MPTPYLPFTGSFRFGATHRCHELAGAWSPIIYFQCWYHCVVLAACAYNMDVDKSWISSTSLSSLQALGQLCCHPKGTHQSVFGTKHPDGSFFKHSLDLTCSQFMPFLSSKTLTEPPFSCEDGGGIPSQPDWSRAGRCHQDVLKSLRADFFSSILKHKLHLKFHAALMPKILMHHSTQTKWNSSLPWFQISCKQRTLKSIGHAGNTNPCSWRWWKVSAPSC